MIKKKHKLLASFMTFVLLLSQIPNLMGSVSAEGNGVASLTWTSGIGTITGDSLDVTPANNTEQTVTLQLSFGLADGETADAGDIQIRLPASIFTGRDGAAVGAISLPLSTTPGEGTTSFYYYIDTNGDVVITNHTAITSDTTFTCDIGYTFTPYLIEDGYTNSGIQASVTVDNQPYTVSNSLTATVNTDAALGSLEKTFLNKYETWQSGWGAEPADAADYFYVIWRVLYKNRLTCTQPYTVTISDNAAPGTVVGYSDSSSGAGAAGASDPVLTMSNPSTTITAYYYKYVVVKYPRSLLTEGVDTVLTNEAVATLAGTDGAAETKTASGRYTYQSVNFTYQGDSFAVGKLTGTSSNGLINAIENNQSRQIGSTAYSFRVSATSKGWSLTENGTKTYTTNLIDDFLYLDGQKLVAGDYGITSFRLGIFTEYDHEINQDTGYTPVESTDYPAYAPVEGWYKTTDGGAWILAGTLVKTGSSTYDYTDASGTRSVSTSSYVDLPEEACAIKFTHTSSRYQVYLNAYICMNLNPTDHVKNIVNNTSTSQLYNIDTLVVTDEMGTIRNSADTSTISGSAMKNDIIAHDTDLYGETVQHDSGYLSLYRLTTSSSLTKTAATKSDAAKGQEILTYTIEMYESSQYSSNALTKEEMIELGVVPEQANGVFYDLLPAGTVADTGSIKVTTYAYNKAGTKTCPYTVELVENWQNSGQTMMIVSVSVPAGTENYSVYEYASATHYLRSGFTLTYKLVYTWQNINDYGQAALNTVAYRAGAGTLTAGGTAAASTVTNKGYYSDLNNDGTDDDGDHNTLYAQHRTTLNPLQASQMGFSKLVKATDGLTYNNTAQVQATGTYSYQLRFANGEGTVASDVVFYDILEAYQSTDASQWKGTLVSIDTSYAENKGINPVIYYSTATGLNSADPTSFQDLASPIWTTVPPADLSTVTAVAIDLSKQTNGNDYQLSLGETMLCYVTMRAPADYESCTNPDVYAYNNATCKITTETTLGSPVTSFKLCNPVSVSLRSADISINKTSDPASGTETEPAVVKRNDTINYTISATNTNTAEVITGVEITDIIPTGLTIDAANLKCYFGTDTPELVSASGRISMTVSGQKLVFMVDKLAAGETVYLVIPTTVPSNAAPQTPYANTAEITAINGSDYSLESPSTYHTLESIYGSLKIGKTVDGTGASTTKEFTFTVTLNSGNGGALTGSFNYTGSKTGTIASGGTVTLKHGENITITGLPEGTAYTVTEADYTADGYTTTATGNTGTIAENVTSQALFENVRNTGGFTIKKVDEDNTSKVLAGAEFTLKDASGSTVSFTWDSVNSQYVYSETATSVVLTSGTDGLIVITGLPVGTYTLTESKSPASYYTASADSWTITVTAEKVTSIEDPSLSWWESIVSAISSLLGIGYGNCLDENGVMTVTNKYVLTPTTVTLTGTKELDGKDLEDDMFSFNVVDNRTATTTTVTNLSDGSISFGTFTFIQAGTYTFTISEAAGSAGGIGYDPSVYTATVTVNDNGNGTLLTSVAYNKGGDAVSSIVFRNTYTVTPTSVTLTGTKTLSGKGLEDDMFSFIVKDTNGSTVATATNKADGTITFSDLTFDTAGAYTYTVSEINGNAGGIAYDDTEYTVTVTVVDNGDGTLTATASYPDGDIAFENSYNMASTTFNLTGTKCLTGKDLKDDMFSFVVTDVDGNTVATATNKADGSIAFGAIGCTEPGTYTYTMSEVNTNAIGITYDDTKYTITVTVVDNGDGTLTATVSYPDGGVVFNNSYDDEGSPDPSDSVDSSKSAPDNPKTGDGNVRHWWTIILCVSFSLLGVFLVISRKKKQQQ